MLLITFALGERLNRVIKITCAPQEPKGQLTVEWRLKDLSDKTASYQCSFLSMLAHELYRPLAMICGCTAPNCCLRDDSETTSFIPAQMPVVFTWVQGRPNAQTSLF